MRKFLHNFFIDKNHKEIMISYIYVSIISLLVLSIFINYIRSYYALLDVAVITLLVFSLGFYFELRSKYKFRLEVSIGFIIFISNIVLAIIVFKEEFQNYSTVFPLLVTFAIFYFYTFKYALITSFMHHLYWAGIYLYGYVNYPDNPLLHNATAMMGLVFSYLFMNMFGFAYSTSTSMYQTKLEESNKQQKLLLQEIHHRVKNNLNIISSILGIQQMSEKNPYIIELMKKNRLRIDSIAMIHEILYKNDNFNKIDFGEYLNQLLGAIKNMYSDDIQLHIQDNKTFLPLDTVLKLGIITNELAINSIKHAFSAHKKKINIYCEQTDNILYYRYSDSGSYDKERTHIWQNANLGLKLIKMMAQQINAEISLPQAEGLVYEIRIPL